jgi:riboflavin kinase/FMN adenylyltransferase
MIILRDGETDAAASEASVVTIGVFDGLHRGHQAIITELVALSKTYDARATVVTFDPSPAMVLAPERAPRLLMTLEQRLEGLGALGVDVVRVLTFNESLQHEAARHFIQRVLIDELRARCVIVGEDFHFGHRREGSVATLSEMGAEVGFDVMAPALFGDTERWSSTAVRRSLAAGDLSGVERILGRPFALRGVVVHGDERGEALGFPTANLKLSPHQALPDEGVYAGATRLDGVWWPCALSLGTRPQFYENGELLVEAHVLGFEGNLYDSKLEVLFLSRLRAQETFASVPELTAQIERDVKKTREIFEEFSRNDAKLLT